MMQNQELFLHITQTIYLLLLHFFHCIETVFKSLSCIVGCVRRSWHRQILSHLFARRSHLWRLNPACDSGAVVPVAASYRTLPRDSWLVVGESICVAHACTRTLPPFHLHAKCYVLWLWDIRRDVTWLGHFLCWIHMRSAWQSCIVVLRVCVACCVREINRFQCSTVAIFMIWAVF